ncbi:hypothetical protein KUH03_08525 [Sphingobacterium sp. E70]|uniref:hypothetical protein n=1 Tax=Sphingobacterium sp. E70 TaxID=2853439 RepID=UPI00211CA53D|nr:hypothetical protein [Sphingobacterium sp. E70]ULT26855.1 hypothetical protein KUH03_08525 [Sphingobacterium sp. E70]
MLKNLRFFEEISILRFDSFTTVCRFQTFKAHSLNREFDETIEVQASQQGYVMTNPGSVIFAKWEDDIFSLSPLCIIYTIQRDTKLICVFTKENEKANFGMNP